MSHPNIIGGPYCGYWHPAGHIGDAATFRTKHDETYVVYQFDGQFWRFVNYCTVAEYLRMQGAT